MAELNQDAARFVNRKRQIGGASVLIPGTDNGQYVSPKDGSFSPWGERPFLIFVRTSPSWRDRTGADINPLNSWYFGIVAGDSGDDSLRLRYRPNNEERIELGYRTAGVWRCQASVGTSGIEWNSLFSAEQHIICRVDPTAGANGEMTIGVLARNTYGGGYTIETSGAVASSAQISMATLGMPGGGYFCWGDSHENFTTAISVMGGFAIVALDPGATFADAGLDTNAGLLKAALDPHGFLSRWPEVFAEKRTFDIRQADGSRFDSIYPRTLGSHVLADIDDPSYVLVKTGAATAEGRGDYEPTGRFPTHRNGVSQQPGAYQLGDVILAGTVSPNSSTSMGGYLDRLEPETGRRLAPGIPLADARRYSLTGGGPEMDCWARSLVPYESHAGVSILPDLTTGRVVCITSFHHESTADWPTSGQTTFETGGVIELFFDDRAPTSRTLPYGAATGEQRTHSYSGGMLERDGYIYWHTRAGATRAGQWRFFRIAPDGAIEFVDLTTSAAADENYPAGAIPYDLAWLDDTKLMAIGGPRLWYADNTLGGYVGIAAVGLDVTQWPGGFFSVVDGAALTLPATYDDPRIYLETPADTRALLEGGVYVAENITKSLTTSQGGMLTRTHNGIGYVGLVVIQSADPKRQIVNDNLTEVLELRVYALDSATMVLTELPERRINLTDILGRQMTGEHPHNQAPSPQFSVGELIDNREGMSLITVSSEGVDFLDAWAGSASANGGVLSALVSMSDLARSVVAVSEDGPSFPVANYNGPTLTNNGGVAQCYGLAAVENSAGRVLITPTLDLTLSANAQPGGSSEASLVAEVLPVPPSVPADALELSGSSSGAAVADELDPSRTWRISPTGSGHQAANLVTLNAGFLGELGFDLAETLEHETLDPALTPSVAITGPAIIGPSEVRLRQTDLRGVVMKFTNALTTAGVYQVSLTATTITGSRLVTTAELEVV